MSIPEQMAVLAGGKSVDMARPSHEQRHVMERLAAILRSTNRDLLQRRRQRQYTRPDTDPPPHAQPADPWTYQHGRQTKSTRYSPLGQDLLAAMQGCSRLGTAIVLTRYAQDRSSMVTAAWELYLQVERLFERRNWRTRTEDKGKDIMRSMCRLALTEANNPRCRTCRGAGVGPRQGQCRTCRGTGNLPIQDQDRAIALGISKQSYRATHKQRYQAVLDLVQSAEESTLRTMRKRLSA